MQGVAGLHTHHRQWQAMPARKDSWQSIAAFCGHTRRYRQRKQARTGLVAATTPSKTPLAALAALWGRRVCIEEPHLGVRASVAAWDGEDTTPPDPPVAACTVVCMPLADSAVSTCLRSQRDQQPVLYNRRTWLLLLLLVLVQGGRDQVRLY